MEMVEQMRNRTENIRRLGPTGGDGLSDMVGVVGCTSRVRLETLFSRSFSKSVERCSLEINRRRAGASGSMGIGFAISFLLRLQVTDALGFLDPQHHPPSSKLVFVILLLQSHFFVNVVSLYLPENANADDLIKMVSFLAGGERESEVSKAKNIKVDTGMV